MQIGFGDALLVVGGLLAAAAALSGVMRGSDADHARPPRPDGRRNSPGSPGARRSCWPPCSPRPTRSTVLSISVLSVALGIILAEDRRGLGRRQRSGVTSSVVTAQRVPSIVRHTLNLESGLNDGLALPFVLFFLVLAQPGGDAGGEAAKLLGEAAFGAFVGVVLGPVGGRLHQHLPGGGITARYEGIYAIGFGLAAFGLADVTIGNGLIAAFAAGITMGVAEHEITDSFVEFAENLSAIFQVVTFFVFGAVIVATGYDGAAWRLVVFILLALLVARPLAIMAAFVRSRLPARRSSSSPGSGPRAWPRCCSPSSC